MSGRVGIWATLYTYVIIRRRVGCSRVEVSKGRKYNIVISIICVLLPTVTSRLHRTSCVGLISRRVLRKRSRGNPILGYDDDRARLVSADGAYLDKLCLCVKQSYNTRLNLVERSYHPSDPLQLLLCRRKNMSTDSELGTHDTHQSIIYLSEDTSTYNTCGVPTTHSETQNNPQYFS